MPADPDVYGYALVSVAPSPVRPGYGGFNIKLYGRDSVHPMSGSTRSDTRTVRTPVRAGLLGALLVLGGCSSTVLLYNNAPWLLKLQLGDYVTLTAPQDDMLDATLQELALWHRESELPHYQDTANRLAESIQDGLTRQEISDAMYQFEDIRRRMAERLIPPISEFLHTLDADQVKEYRAAVLENIEEDREEMAIAPAQRLAERFEKTVERLEDWVGTLSGEQLTSLRPAFAGIPDRRDYYLNRREQRLEQFTQFMQDSPSPDRIDAYLREIYLREPSAEERAKLSVRAEWIDFFLVLDQSLTPEQRKHALGELSGYANDFAELHLSLHAEQLADSGERDR